ncbi:hypothetical protein ACFL5T_01740 [Gemmatimonadota bacterium]
MATLRKVYLSASEFSRLAEQVNCVGWLGELKLNRPNAEWVIRKWAKRWGVEAEIRRVLVFGDHVMIVCDGPVVSNMVKRFRFCGYRFARSLGDVGHRSLGDSGPEFTEGLGERS